MATKTKVNEHESLIRLIQASRKAGVESLDMNDSGLISVKFQPGEAARTPGLTGETVPTVDLQELAANVATARKQNFALSAEDQLAQLQIDDPDAYEQALIERELGNGEEPNGTDEL